MLNVWLRLDTHLEEFVLEGHVRLGLETNAGAEDVRESCSLLGESVDDGSTRRCQGSLGKLVFYDSGRARH